MHAASQIAATASVIECASRNTINAIEIDISRVVCVGCSNVVCVEFADGAPQTTGIALRQDRVPCNSESDI